MHTTDRSGWVLAGLAALLLSLAILAGCGTSLTPDPPPMAYACGTNDTPPVAVDEVECRGAKPNVQWYSGRADDLDEPDERVVIGQPLDEDWWDPAAKADLDDLHSTHATNTQRPGVPVTSTRTVPPPTTTTAAPTRRSTPATPAPTTRRPR